MNQPPAVLARLSSRFPRGWIAFNRMELAGSFGDIGTDLPLLVGVILAAQMDAASVLIGFGIMQLFSALVYGAPMPVQPLKAVAALVIAGSAAGVEITEAIVLGGGLAIGACMLLLSLSGAVNWLARVIPPEVVRGIQFGLGLKLASVALGTHIASDGWTGYLLAGVCMCIVILLRKARRFPAALVIIALGIVYATLFNLDQARIAQPFGFSLPKLHAPQASEIWQGFLILALAQIPLSLGNSILATTQLAKDYFPERKISVRKVSLTYSLMNLALPFVSGMPACHGSGGLAGHYAFGARTGGSVFIYGLFYLSFGLFLSNGFTGIIQVFPLPVLGVILMFEALYLMVALKHTLDTKAGLFTALFVGMVANWLPYGFLIGLVAGTLVAYLHKVSWSGKESVEDDQQGED